MAVTAAAGAQDLPIDCKREFVPTYLPSLRRFIKIKKRSYVTSVSYIAHHCVPAMATAMTRHNLKVRKSRCSGFQVRRN